MVVLLLAGMCTEARGAALALPPPPCAGTREGLCTSTGTIVEEEGAAKEEEGGELAQHEGVREVDGGISSDTHGA